MSTPKPLIESSASDRARELLRAARADGPRPGTAGRALTALGVVGTTATAAGAATAAASTSTAAGLGASSVASLPMIAVKWLLVGTLCGGALASGSSLVFSTASRSSSPATPAKLAPSVVATTRAETLAPAAKAAPPPAAAASAPAPASDKAAKPAASTPASDVGESTPPPASAPSQAAFASPEQSKLLHDVALLDDARRALRANDTARTLALLTRYDAERQTRILDREAQLLRIEVFTTRGERARARELAREYLATFPNDAHAERLRALAGIAPETGVTTP